MKSWKLPIDVRTNTPCTHVTPNGETDTPYCKWVEPYEFEDTLEFMTILKGRSAINFVFKSRTDGRQYSFGPGGFISACRFSKVVGIEGGFTITGRFGFVKRGQNYLVEAIVPCQLN